MNMSNKSTSETEEKNPYILLREAKIARNKARLEELGLLGNASHSNIAGSEQVTSSVVLASVDSMNHDVTKKRKSYSGKKNLHSDDPVSMPPPRRSSRLQSAGANTSTDDDDKNHDGKSNTSTRTQNSTSILMKENQMSDDGTTRISTIQKKTTSRNEGTPYLNPNSTKLQEINIQNILFGKSSPSPNGYNHHFSKVGMLGRMIEFIGKGPVVQHAGLLDSESITIFSFNKYSGITEWKNDVLFLWINIGGELDSDSVVNEFLDGGKQITWYGGSMMHNDTPVIQKLIKIGIKAKSNNNHDTSDKSGIVLWCRMYDKQRRHYRPYACLGRLSYDSHDPGSHPVKFIFNLLDYDILLKSSVFKCIINNVDIIDPMHV